MAGRLSTSPSSPPLLGEKGRAEQVIPREASFPHIHPASLGQAKPTGYSQDVQFPPSPAKSFARSPSGESGVAYTCTVI